ncbi:MAG: LytTR family DNA-binding domain-containing protein [Clostridia bacterium]|nr:LytTR family DNA-binding domain-containing protein [Clostridia bacterium]
MTKYTVCICDDETSVRSELRKYILRYSFIQDVEIDIMELNCAEKLFDLSPEYDILFLDIRFGTRTVGIDVAEKLRKMGNTSVIVIMTALKSMCIEGYRAEPFRFLLKPFTEEQIHTVLRACLSKLNRTICYIRVLCDSQWELIRSDRIMYIYSKLRKRYIVCAGNETIVTWQSLGELMGQAPSGKFAFSHKSYIVNLDAAASVRSNEVILTDGTAIPLGTHYKDTFMKALLLNTTN